MNLKFTVSAKHNTNELISSSDDKFAGITNGSLIKIENDPILHTVQDKKPTFYINEFNLDSGKVLTINDDVGVYLQKSDCIKMTYKEYEARFIMEIKNGGFGYVIGDTFPVIGGTLDINISTGAIDQTILEVVETDENGAATKLNIKHLGRYLVPPEQPVKVLPKRGGGLEVDIKYLELSNRSILERTIENIYLSEGKTFIVLDYSLPANLKTGKISVEKNILILTENYTGETARNLGYQIFRDFTPNLRMPLMLKNSMSPDIIHNKALLILDKEIGEIKKKLGIS